MARQLPLLRVLWKFGLRRSLAVVALLWLGFTVFATLRTATPAAAIGSDPSNYYAAGERLNAGHSLYALEAGDRAVLNGRERNPWPYPLLSPPPIAVLWRPLALVPGGLSMEAWWLLGAVCSAGLVLWLVARSSAIGLAAIILLTLPEAGNIWTGNLNLLLIPAAALTWLTVTRGMSRTAGAVVGMATILKLTPAMYLWWFIVRRDKQALATAAATIGVGLVVSILGAGLASHLEYFNVAREANSTALSSLSAVTVARGLGVPDPWALLAPYVLAAIAAVVAWLLRHDLRWSFVACVVGATVGTPDLRFDTLAGLLPALVPFSSSSAHREPLVASDDPSERTEQRLNATPARGSQDLVAARTSR